MDELSLEALMAELAQVQKAPTVTKLSEPNVVEVMQKLVDLGMLDVLFTTNGKEYLTPKQLRYEVEDEILAHGGRVNVTELPPILNVDLPYVERVVEALLKDDPTLQLFQGDVIASYYLDGVAEEINQTLQSEGRVMLGDLAMQYSLTTDFVRALVEPRLGTAVQAKLSGSTLYTSSYVARHGARVRGVLSAVLRPASLPQLVREHGFNENLFHECLDELQATGRLPGSVLGKSSYTPAVHAHAQAASVKSFFEQNGVIEYAKLGMKEPKAYLRAHYPNGVELGTVYMKRELLEAAEAEVEEACTNRWAVDVRSCFDVELSAEDLATLLEASTSVAAALAAGRAIELGGGLLASAGLMEESPPVRVSASPLSPPPLSPTRRPARSPMGGRQRRHGPRRITPCMRHQQLGRPRAWHAAVRAA